MAPIDPQDPLPEPTWLWRRVYVYAVSVVFLILISITVERLAQVATADPSEGIAAMLSALQWLIGALICVLTYYLVAPSAEQIVKLVQAARLQSAKSAPEPPPKKHDKQPPRFDPPDRTPWQ